MKRIDTDVKLYLTLSDSFWDAVFDVDWSYFAIAPGTIMPCLLYLSVTIQQ